MWAGKSPLRDRLHLDKACPAFERAFRCHPRAKPFRMFPASRIRGSLLFPSCFTTSKSWLLTCCMISIYPTNFLRIHEKENRSLTSMPLSPPCPQRVPQPVPTEQGLLLPLAAPPAGPWGPLSSEAVPAAHRLPSGGEASTSRGTGSGQWPRRDLTGSLWLETVLR